MEIGYYIGDLLREQDEVSVPGLGTFFKLRIPGSFDRGSNRFFPPSYQLAFKKTNGNYQALAEYISKEKKLSISSAEYFIKKFSSNIYDLLQQNGFAEIQPLGLIHKTNEELTFENRGNYSLSDELFGLKPLEYKTVTPAAEPVTPVEPERPYVTSSIEDFITGMKGPEEETLAETQLDSEEQEIADANPARLSPLLTASLVLALLVLSGFLLYRFNPGVREWIDQQRNPVNEVNEPAAGQDRSAPLIDTFATDPTDTVKQDSVIQNAPANGPDEATPARNTEAAVNSSLRPAEKAVPTEPELVYEIVVATFGRKADAELYISQLAQKKIKAHIAENIPGPKTKVSVASIANKAAAEKEFARVRKELNEEAWMQLVPKKKNP